MSRRSWYWRELLAHTRDKHPRLETFARLLKQEEQSLKKLEYSNHENESSFASLYLHARSKHTGTIPDFADDFVIKLLSENVRVARDLFEEPDIGEITLAMASVLPERAEYFSKALTQERTERAWAYDEMRSLFTQGRIPLIDICSNRVYLGFETQLEPTKPI